MLGNSLVWHAADVCSLFESLTTNGATAAVRPGLPVGYEPHRVILRSPLAQGATKDLSPLARGPLRPAGEGVVMTRSPRT